MRTACQRLRDPAAIIRSITELAPRTIVVDVEPLIATDGVLARRLGYSFIHYYPDIGIPLAPRLMRYIGFPLQPFLFKNRFLPAPAARPRG